MSRSFHNKILRVNLTEGTISVDEPGMAYFRRYMGGWNFVADTLPSTSAGMCYRVAVRAVEAWLLADVERLAAYLGISQALIPRTAPDQDDDPKRTLVNLARRSRKRAIREGMAPRPESRVRVGPAYLSCVQAFVSADKNAWRPLVAQERSDSLRRCLLALDVWRPR